MFLMRVLQLFLHKNGNTLEILLLLQGGKVLNVREFDYII